MAKSSASINLLRNEQKETVEHIIDWAVTIGRVLVIVVELAALTAFLYRFVLDNQLQDLQTKIKQKQAIVAYQKDSEDTYRNLQERLAVASSYGNVGRDDLKIIKDILSFAPDGMAFTTVAFSPGRMQIEANVESIIPLSNFINKLRAYSLIDTISLDKIENKTSSSIITVGISTTFKQQGGTNAAANN